LVYISHVIGIFSDFNRHGSGNKTAACPSYPSDFADIQLDGFMNVCGFLLSGFLAAVLFFGLSVHYSLLYSPWLIIAVQPIPIYYAINYLIQIEGDRFAQVLVNIHSLLIEPG
jgi:hypothetical protein